jgi:alanyl-tRNA synthetase
MMGPTGPCGPCTEIFYDHGDHIPGGPPGSPDEDGDRFIEIWNLVFMQFEQFEDGSRKPLPNPSIDTGMGLERVGALLQGKHDNYDTDLMRSLIEAAANATSTDPDGPGKVHHRVIADHLRSTAFLIADGVMPSNEGRGYVLRRIMRRAMRHAHLLGADEPLMHRLVPALVQQMGAAYPELGRAQALIRETLRLEETRFRQTLDRGLRLLDEELGRIPEGSDLPGDAAFKLYDTFGFPLDLTQDALREMGRRVDTAGFDAAMAEQKAKARAAWAGTGETADVALWFDLAETHGATEFLGYDTETRRRPDRGADPRRPEGRQRDDGRRGPDRRQPDAVLRRIRRAGGRHRHAPHRRRRGAHHRHAEDGRHLHPHRHRHRGHHRAGEGAVLEVDHARRSAIRANHSATHLLHEALREALGDHVAQRGSLNAEDRLRFDFSHSKALSPEEIARVETR